MTTGFTQPLSADLPLEGSIGGRGLGATHVLSARGKQLEVSTGADIDVTNVLNDLDKLKADLWDSIGGLTPSHAADTDHDITISPGACADATNVLSMYLGAALTKQIDADWAEGTDDGGLATGARSVADTPNASTWYHLFKIIKIDVESAVYTIDAGFDTDMAATNLLADATNYSHYRRVHSVLTDGSNNIIQQLIYKRSGGGLLVRWVTPATDGDYALTTTYEAKTLTSPLGYSVEAFGNVYGNATTQFRPVGAADADPVAGVNPFGVRSDSGGTGGGKWFCPTDSASQIEMADTGGTNTELTTEGWVDHRVA